MFRSVTCTLLTYSAATVIGLAMCSTIKAGTLNIANAGFEADTAPAVGASGWTITSGGTDWFTTTAGQPDSAVDPDTAFEGSNWLSGNRLAAGAGSSSNPQLIEQLIDISAESSLIDTGNAGLELGFAFADNDQNDNATVNVRFYSDAVGASEIVGSDLTTGVIAETGGEFNTPAPWDQRSLSGTVPIGARSLAIELRIDRLSGSAGNVHFDDFSGELIPEPSTVVLVGFGIGTVAWGYKRSRRTLVS